VALSCGSPRLAVSQHLALWSPDLPRPGRARPRLLWTVAFLANASVTLWLLLTASLQTFVLAKLALSPVVEGSAVVLSVLLFRQVLRHEGLRLGFRPLGVDTTAH
jgi:hypothetical protein